jgi:hypothetical protein
MIFTDDEQLRAACERWKKVLRLQDWIVDVQLVRRESFSDGESASVEYNLFERTALVRVLDSRDYAGEDQNHEISLVHELVHLMLAGLDPLIKDNGMADVVLERSVRTIAVALVQMLEALRQTSCTTEITSTEDAPLVETAVV